MKEYLKTEALHTAAAIALTVAVAVAADLSGVESFESVSLTGLGLTALRSFATAVVVLGSKYVVKA